MWGLYGGYTGAGGSPTSAESLTSVASGSAWKATIYVYVCVCVYIYIYIHITITYDNNIMCVTYIIITIIIM